MFIFPHLSCDASKKRPIEGKFSGKGDRYPMNEVKSPKKPLLYYYFVAMLLVMLFNFIAIDVENVMKQKAEKFK